jgi:hypothetical protein
MGGNEVGRWQSTSMLLGSSKMLLLLLIGEWPNRVPDVLLLQLLAVSSTSVQPELLLSAGVSVPPVVCNPGRTIFDLVPPRREAALLSAAYKMLRFRSKVRGDLTTDLPFLFFLGNLTKFQGDAAPLPRMERDLCGELHLLDGADPESERATRSDGK